MNNPAKAFAVRSPAHIGLRVNGAVGRLLKAPILWPRKKAAQYPAQGYAIDRQGRFASCAPGLIVAVGKQRRPDLGELRSAVLAVLRCDSLKSKIFRVKI